MSAQPITFGSLCSGIEAASEAWLPIGWQCGYVAEVEPFPCSYLAQTYGAMRPLRMPSPDGASLKDARARRTAIKALDKIRFGHALPNFGDVSQIAPDELLPVDIIAAGFPCQDFSLNAAFREGRDGAAVVRDFAERCREGRTG